MIGSTENGHTLRIPKLFSGIFNFYRRHFSLFWQVMIPLILFSFLTDLVILNGFYRYFPNTSWVVGTSDGFSVTTVFGLTQHQTFTFTFSSFITIFLWFAMCPLALTTFQLCRDMNVSVLNIWQQALRRFGSIFGASFLLLVLFICVGICFLLLSTLFALPTDAFPLFIVFGLVFIFVMSYFMVRWSLFNQCIIIENRSALQAFRRSSELVQGRWWGFFVRYLLLVWGAGVLTGVVFAFTFIQLSIVEPEFILIRNDLLSEKIISILIGIDAWVEHNNVKLGIGDIDNALSGTPRFMAIGIILVIKTLIYALLTPIWAILTTHLYLEQTGGEVDSGEIPE
jgi:xanthosine utilization system XapX-like protein